MNPAGYLTSGFAPLVTGIWKQSLGIHKMMRYASLQLVAAAIVLSGAIRFLVPLDYKRVH